MGVADEDDVGALVAPLQEKVQQHEEALGEILLAFAHRARHVHQAEHDGVGVRHGLRLEAVEADVDRIDIGDQLAPARQPLELFAQRRDRARWRQLAQRLGLQRPRARRAIASSSCCLGRLSAMRRP